MKSNEVFDGEGLYYKNKGAVMNIPTYEDWVGSLSKKELEKAYMLGGSKDDIGLMRAYHQIFSKDNKES